MYKESQEKSFSNIVYNVYDFEVPIIGYQKIVSGFFLQPQIIIMTHIRLRTHVVQL